MADLAKLVDELSALTVMEAAELSKMLEEKWGVSAAAAVAVASLAQAVETGVVGKDEMIMLNITGGGEKLAWKEHEICHAKPALILDPADDENVIISKVEALFK